MSETLPISDGYWAQTRRPMACLVFLLPLLTLYEVGTLWAEQHGVSVAPVRNGADAWMRHAVERAGFNPAFFLPFLLVMIFAAWQASSRQPWTINAEVTAGMLGECLVLAVALMVVGRVQDIVFERIETAPAVASIGDARASIEDVIRYIGAGIYEETLFRLLLLPAVYFLLSCLGIPTGLSMAAAITTSALTFSLAHYLGPADEPFLWFDFIFRWVAGLFFAGVFVLRGFGVAVGVHAIYDILIGVFHFKL